MKLWCAFIQKIKELNILIDPKNNLKGPNGPGAMFHAPKALELMANL
jgi:hypothetical protein